MTAYLCPGCGNFMSGKGVCQGCGAEWIEDHADPSLDPNYGRHWWQVEWPPYFGVRLFDHYKSIWLGWLLITWARDEDKRLPWPRDIHMSWYPAGD